MSVSSILALSILYDVSGDQKAKNQSPYFPTVSRSSLLWKLENGSDSPSLATAAARSGVSSLTLRVFALQLFQTAPLAGTQLILAIEAAPDLPAKVAADDGGYHCGQSHHHPQESTVEDIGDRRASEAHGHRQAEAQ